MKAMKTMPEVSWRQPMWTELMRRLPASITISMKTKSYAVRDNSLQYIYSDDIDEHEVDSLIGELAEELPYSSRCEFCDALSMEKMKRAWKEGREGYTLLSQMDRHTLRTDVVFGQSVHEMIMELRLSIFDTNTLFLAGIRMADEHGAK